MKTAEEWWDELVQLLSDSWFDRKEIDNNTYVLEADLYDFGYKSLSWDQLLEAIRQEQLKKAIDLVRKCEWAGVGDESNVGINDVIEAIRNADKEK